MSHGWIATGIGKPNLGRASIHDPGQSRAVWAMRRCNLVLAVTLPRPQGHHRKLSKKKKRKISRKRG